MIKERMKSVFTFLLPVALIVGLALGNTDCGSSSNPSVPSPFTATGSMVTARVGHTATLLSSGKVLIAGGTNITSGLLASAELYDPVAGTFTETGSLATKRQVHTATLLQSGKVLISGGMGLSGSSGSSISLATAELYDPDTGTFTATGNLALDRYGHPATLLQSGKVLIVGGYKLTATSGYLASAELYDPASGTFTATGSLTTAREDHTATLLSSGKVLITGGWGASEYIASAELYDPVSGTFTATGSLLMAREGPTATLLKSDEVIIAGGYNSTTPKGYLASAELYDPVAGTFTSTGSLATERGDHTATLLSSGKVLIVGGYKLDNPIIASAELYDPVAGTFTETGNLVTARFDHTATLLSNGKVLIAGGQGNSGDLASAELY